MIWQANDDNQLIELVRSTLPQDLTDAQIAALRRAIHTSPQVRDALLEEVRFETGLAARLAPQAMAPEEFIERLEAMASVRSRMRWLWLSIILVMIMGLVGGGVGIALNLSNRKPPVDPLALNDGDGQGGTGKNGGGKNGGGTAMPMGPVDPVVPDVPLAPDNVQPAEKLPPLSQLPLPPVSPDWKLYDDAAARGDRTWTGRLPTFFRPIAGKLQLNPQEGVFHLNGRYEVVAPSAEGRVVRLRLSDSNKLRFMLWGHEQGVSIERRDDGLLYATAIQRDPAVALDIGLSTFMENQAKAGKVIDRIDPQVYFKWGSGAPLTGLGSRHFAIRWEGILKVPANGLYRFYSLTTNDGIIVKIGGQKVIEKWLPPVGSQGEGDIELKAGDHPIVIDFFNEEDDGSVKIEWEGPGIGRQKVPPAALRTSSDPAAAMGLTGRYTSGYDRDKLLPTAGRLLADDNGLWRFYRNGVIDLRYQEGHVILARGPIPLLRVPMAQPPTQLFFEGQTQIWLGEDLNLKPLKLDEPASVAAAAGNADTRKAGTLTWKMFPEDREKVVTLSPRQDGTLDISRQADSTLDYRVLTTLDTKMGEEIIVEVLESSHDMALCFQVPGENEDNHALLRWGRLDDAFVICHDPRNVGEMQQRAKQGFTLSGRFFVKAVYGLDHLTLFHSNDRVNWIRFQHREIEPSRLGVKPQIRFGVFGAWDTGERRLRLGDITIRRSNAIESLADPALIAKVPEPVDNANHYLPRAYDVLSLAALSARPTEVDERAWRMAVNAKLLAGAVRPRVRQEAAVDLINAAIDAGLPVERVLPAILEIPRRLTVSHDEKQFLTVYQVASLFDQLAQRAWAQGRRDELPRLLDAWYTIRHWGPLVVWLQPRYTAPITAARLNLFSMWDQGQWEPLRQASMRAEFLSHHFYPWRDTPGEDYPVRALAAWMNSQASEYLTDGPPMGERDRYGDRMLPTRFASHPLAMEADRESTNTVAELLATVESKAYDHACKLLTRQSLPDGIAPVDREGRLHKATHVLLRQLIDSNPEIARLMKEQYAPVGMLRLRQALDQGRLDALEPLVTQFHGTEAARQALALLADRDLSTGNFIAAASRYDELIRQSDEKLRPQFAAKRRLALAMAGELTGEPVKHPVELGGRSIPPAEFEQLVNSLVQERRGSGDGGVQVVSQPVDADAPGPLAMKLTQITELPLPNGFTDRDRAGRNRKINWAQSGNTLLVHQHGRLTAVDLPSKKVLWRKEESARDLPSYAGEPAAPLIIGDRAYVPFFRSSRHELTCVNLAKGDTIWKQTFDDGLAGDPVAVGPWLYVLSVQRQTGDYGDLILRRLSPETGESVLAKRVMRARYGEELFRVGRPLVIGESLLFRAGSALVSCDTLGSTRWVRRLSLVPPSVDSALFDYQDMSDLVLDGGRVIVTAPGSPHVACIDAATGEEVWSYLQPRLRRLLGRRGDHIIILTTSQMQALDIKTGRVAWSRPLVADYDAVLPAAGDQILTLTLDRISGKKDEIERHIRRVEWISAASGRTVKVEPVDELAADAYDAENIFTDGKWVVAVTNMSTKAKGQNGKLVVLEKK